MRRSECLQIYDMNLSEYGGLLECVNANYLQQTKEELTRLSYDMTKHGRNCFFVVGSDGKEERHPQSRTEVVFVFERRELAPSPREIIDKYEKISGRTYPFETLKGLPDVLSLDQERPLSFAFGDSSLVYPDRVLNSKLILGDKDLHTDARVKVVDEMIGSNARKIRRELRQQRNSYAKACVSGEYRGKIIFEEGVQYYDESPDNYRLGFKIAYLRLMQRSLDLVLNRIVKEVDIRKDEVSRMPTSTIGRINFYAKSGFIPIGNNLIRKGQLAYLWFLREYHKAQEFYKNSAKVGVAIPFDIGEYEMHRQNIGDFLEAVDGYKLS